MYSDIIYDINDIMISYMISYMFSDIMYDIITCMISYMISYMKHHDVLTTLSCLAAVDRPQAQRAEASDADHDPDRSGSWLGCASSQASPFGCPSRAARCCLCR